VPSYREEDTTMKPLRSIAAFAMAGLVAAFMMAGLTGTLDVAAVAAVPAVATAPIHASAGSMVRPSHANGPVVDINCPHGFPRFYAYYFSPGSCANPIDWSCTAVKHSIKAPYSVWNNCKADIVILYSNPDESGSLMCIDPATGTDQGTWRSFQIVAVDSCTLDARVR
jgi:hypothetical protein